jgi:hypothetical protein
MLVIVILGMSLGSNVSWLLGAPVVIAGLLCFNLGNKLWRAKQENSLILIGLLCGVFVLIVSALS